jgi:transcriptional regulator with XRE-family HTH domain
MSTAISEQHSSESLSVAVARRLRGQLAERNIKGSALSRMTGLPQQTISRKLLGGTPFTLDELHDICDVTGISLEFILLGTRNSGTGPVPPQDGESSPKSKPVSEREPLDYKVVVSAEKSNVHEFTPRRWQPAGDQPLRRVA